MNVKVIGYWIATALTAAALGFGAFSDLTHAPEIVAGMRHLGYAEYVATILGVWKVLAVLAILAPRFPLVKEWAYAGIFIELSGASASHAFTGDPVGKIMTPAAILVVAMLSWWLRPASRRLAGTVVAL